MGGPATAAQRLERFEYKAVRMGVQARLVLYAPDAAAARTAAAAALDRMAALEDVMSDYRPTSELMRLCGRPAGTPVAVSEDLFAVLARAQALAERSAGAFDVTVGPFVQLWRAARRTGVLPADAALAAARPRVGWEKLLLDPAARTATLLAPGMRLDLGGIAKGYAVDAALQVLAAHGIDRALVVFGGDMAASGPPPGLDGWPVEVAHADAAHRHLALAHAAVSTSGDTGQFVEIDGVRYSHVVDPRTGLGLTTRLAATVVAPDAFTTDPLATLVATLGPAAGPAFVAAHAPGATVYVRRVEE